MADATTDPQELQNRLRAARDERARLTFQHGVARLKDPMQLRRARREIARLQTFIRAQEAVK